MRVDKYLKVARIIKRRSIANQACSVGAIKINEKNAKPGTKVKIGDIITVELGTKIKKYKVFMLVETVSKEQARNLYMEIS